LDQTRHKHFQFVYVTELAIACRKEEKWKLNTKSNSRSSADLSFDSAMYIAGIYEHEEFS
jgi:hypothetical protein